MISRSTIDRVFESARVEEVIGEFVQLKKAGSNFKGLSPFTDEKSPSFMVSPVKQIWKDFSTGKGGNAVSFLMEHEHYTYPEALRWLAKKYNIEIEETEQTDEQKQVEQTLIELADQNAKKLNISRRKFLASTGGMAAAFLAMNTVFGEMFEVSASELLEPAASAEKFPKTPFIFDIHTHHVETGKVIENLNLLNYRNVAGFWGNADLKDKKHKNESDS